MSPPLKAENCLGEQEAQRREGKKTRVRVRGIVLG